MNRLILAAALLAAASCAPGGGGHGQRMRLTADPSAVIAAELGLAQLALIKGRSAAFRETAAPDAELFMPQRVRAADWLKGRADPEAPIRWQPHAVWSSCDGTYAVTRGAWQRAGASGRFATLWQRQERGDYKWLLNLTLPGKDAQAAPEMVPAKVAACERGATIIPWSPPPAGTDAKIRFSPDLTLQWSSSVDAGGAPLLTALIWNGTSFDEALRMGGVRSES